MTELNIEVYDNGAFTVFKSRFGLYNAKDREGNGICCSISKESCIFWARNHLFGPLPDVTTIYTNVKIGNDSLK